MCASQNMDTITSKMCVFRLQIVAMAVCTARFQGYQQVIANMFRQKDLDVTFYFPHEGTPREVLAHKELLTLVSPVFKVMFSGNWKEKDAVCIKDADADVFYLFINFIYGNETPIDEGNVIALLDLATKYQIDHMIPKFAEYMSGIVRVANAVGYLSVAILYGLPGLESKCKEIISDCTDDVLRTDGFLDCHASALPAILGLPWIACTEADLFDASVEWARRRCRQTNQPESGENMRRLLGDSFELIRFQEMEERKFWDRYAQHKGELFTPSDMLAMFSIRSAADANRRQRRPLQLQISTLLMGFVYNYKFPAVRPCPIDGRTESVIHFSVSKPVLLTELHMPKVFVANCRSGTLDSRTYLLECELLHDHTVLQSFDVDVSKHYGGIPLYTKVPMLPRQQYTIKVYIPGISRRTAYMFGHDVFSQTLNGVDLLVKRDGSLRRGSPNWVAGLTFEATPETHARPSRCGEGCSRGF